MPVLIIILILLAVAVAAAILIPRFFTIEKVEVAESAGQTLPAVPAEAGEKPLVELDDSTLREKMGLVDGTGGDEENAETKAAAEKSAEFSSQEGAILQERAEERIATVDRLTNFIAGRSYLLDCQKALNEAKPGGHTYAAAYFDFDRFRFLNSMKGMVTGDYVLTRLSQELSSVFPPDSMITRISADHFTVLFPVADSEIYVKLDEGLRALCEKVRGDMAIKGALRIRMGIAVTDMDMDYDIRVLVHKANIARYCIKTSRDESFRLYDDGMLSSYLYGDSALEDYSENQYDEEFVLYYTPIEDVSLHALAGCEVLARWACEDENEKILPPKHMLPSNSAKVIYQACKAMSRWRKAGKQPLPVSIYVPPTELFKADFDEYLAKVLSEFQLEPSCLQVVIDAAEVRLDWSTVSRQIKRIADIGVGVGVDEVDTGYANLDFLHELSVSFIKLHRSFTRGLENNNESSDSANRLLHMIDLAKARGMTVYLEGVDSKELADLAGELGVRMVQGAFAGRPQKADDFAQGLAAYIERRNSKDTVILDNAALSQGNFNVF